MRLMLHTFKKDVRRFWPAAVVLWLMLGGLANADRMRAFSEEIYGEGYLTLLTAMAWACLIGLVTLEEPLTGDRNFWTTRPHRWGALLGSKLLFAILAIHLPSFLMEMISLATAGFPPAESFAPVLRQQVLFFGVLTLPAMACASLVRNFTHFVLLILVFATGFLVIDGALSVYRRAYSEPGSHVASEVVIAAAAIATLWIQYARRRVIYARGAMVAGALAAVSLFNYQAYAGWRSGGASPRISLNGAPFISEARQSLTVPIGISGVPGHFRPLRLDAEAVAPDGTVLQTGGSRGYRQFPAVLAGYSDSSGDNRLASALAFHFAGSSWQRLRGDRVRIRGQARFELYETGPKTAFPAQGRHAVPGLGWCTTIPQVEPFSGQTVSLRLICESLLDRPNASVTLVDEASGWRSRARMGSQPEMVRGLRGKWFSPVHLVSYYFPILNADRAHQFGAANFALPEAAVPTAHFEITPTTPARQVVSKFDFGELKLAR